MKLIALLKLLMPEQLVKIYNPPDILNTPDYEGEAGSTPWWLAEMKIDESVGVAVDEDGFLEITVKEEETTWEKNWEPDTIDLTGHPIKFPWDIIK